MVTSFYHGEKNHYGFFTQVSNLILQSTKKIFALDLRELEESIDIEFSLGEHDGLWIGKTEDKVSGTDIFWLLAGTGERCDFTTFQEMVEAKLFDGKNLKSVWADVTLTFIGDHDMSF